MPCQDNEPKEGSAPVFTTQGEKATLSLLNAILMSRKVESGRRDPLSYHHTLGTLTDDVIYVVLLDVK